MSMQITECSTSNLITASCTSTWSFGSISGSMTSPPNPWSWQVPTNGYGTYSASVNCAGYAPQSSTFVLTSSTTLVTFCVSRLNIPITVTECGSSIPLSASSSVQISGSNSYSAAVTVPASSSYLWTVPAFGNFNFVTNAPGYPTSTVSMAISAATTAVNLCVSRQIVPVFVVDCQTNRAIPSTATVVVTRATVSSYSATLTVSSGSSASWTVPGYDNFSFSTSASGYLTNTQTMSVSSSTTSVTVCVSPSTVLVDIRIQDTNTPIEVGAVVTFSGVSSGSFRWNGLYTWTYSGVGQYSFLATPDSKYTTGTLTVTVTSSTTLIIIYVKSAAFCGDKSCNNGETFDTCQLDCVALFLEFENADGSGPVNGPTANFFLSNPRDSNEATGPNRNSVAFQTSRTTGNGSNTVLESTYSYNQIVYFEVVVSTFINFYWVANTSNIDRDLGTYRLRVHLSKNLGSTDYTYRFVNTWKPIDATPTPYGPTDLNLHLFHSAGALDINNPTLLSSGFQIGKAVADSKQSGGPATMDISPGSSQRVAVWNSKPPRSSVIAPSQNNRFLVDSGSYVVFYGKTSNAANGKQVGQVVLDQLFIGNPSLKSNHQADLWYVGNFQVSQPGVNQPEISSVGTLKSATITSTKDMIFDCEAYSYCAQFKVPFSDTGRKREEYEVEQSFVVF